MKSPTLAEIKSANPEFFSRANNKFFGTYNWRKSGRIIWSPGKHGHTSRRWVDYETLELHSVLTYQINRAERWFITVTENESSFWQEINHSGDMIGERLSDSEWRALFE